MCPKLYPCSSKLRVAHYIMYCGTRSKIPNSSQINSYSSSLLCLPSLHYWLLQHTQYMYAPHNDVSVNDGPHLRRWSHEIIIQYIYNIHSLVFSLEGRAWQEPEPSQVTGMTLAHCILGKFLGVICHCFPPPLDVRTLAARCLRPQRRERS